MFIQSDLIYQRRTVQVRILLLVLSRDYVGHHVRLAVLILGSALVLPKVNGLHVLHGEDALRDEGGASHPPCSPASWTPGCPPDAGPAGDKSTEMITRSSSAPNCYLTPDNQRLGPSFDQFGYRIRSTPHSLPGSPLR